MRKFLTLVLFTTFFMPSFGWLGNVNKWEILFHDGKVLSPIYTKSFFTDVTCSYPPYWHDRPMFKMTPELYDKNMETIKSLGFEKYLDDRAPLIHFSFGKEKMCFVGVRDYKKI